MAAKETTCIIIDPVDEHLVNGLIKQKITVDYKPNIPKSDLIGIINKYDILIGRNRMPVDKPIIEKASRLRTVVRAGTGTENIDSKELEKKGIKLISAPGTAVESVAELAICLMIIAARDVYNDMSLLKGGTFKKGMGMELEGKTLGVLGFGRIGRRIAELAKAFNMNILASDVVDLSEKAKEMGASFVSFNEIFSRSDIISINLSMEGNNKPIIDGNTFKMMKEGVILVNTARAEAVDLHELHKNISNGRVGFYATDVLWNEPPKDEIEIKLLGNKRFVSTSHIGAQTGESQRRIAEHILKALADELGKKE